MSNDKKNIPQNKLCKQWEIFCYAILHPIAVIAFVAAIAALLSANVENINKTTSVLLQIIASILTGVWGGFIWDAIKESSQNSLLFKKGQSAVRSLGLSRGKVRNLISRTKESASTEEVMNLLSLLEKDIANATQEWHDIVPGIQQVEGIYSVLSEAETAVNNLQKQIDELNKKLSESQQLNSTEKQDLSKKLKDKEEQVEKLSFQINELQSQKNLLSLASTTSGTMPIINTSGALPQFSLPKLLCKKCGKELSPVENIIFDSHCPGCWPTGPESLGKILK